MNMKSSLTDPPRIGDSITFVDHANQSAALVTGVVIHRTDLELYMVQSLNGAVTMFAPECNLPASAEYLLVAAAPTTIKPFRGVSS